MMVKQRIRNTKPQTLGCELTFFPVPTRESLTKTHNPLSTFGIARVLPRGLDSLSKEMIVSSIRQVIGPHQIIVCLPKPFDRLDGAN